MILLLSFANCFVFFFRVNSGAQIKIAGNEGDGSDRLVTITGTPEAVGMAQYLINSRCYRMLSLLWMMSVYFQIFGLQNSLRSKQLPFNWNEHCCLTMHNQALLLFLLKFFPVLYTISKPVLTTGYSLYISLTLLDWLYTRTHTNHISRSSYDCHVTFIDVMVIIIHVKRKFGHR